MPRVGEYLDLVMKLIFAFGLCFQLPVALTLFGGQLLDDSLSGRIRADTADFAIVEAFSPDLQNSTGRISADLAIGGTWKRPTIGGTIAAVGQRLLDTTARMIIKRFFEKLSAEAAAGAGPTVSGAAPVA